MIVMKFGGSSLESTSAILRVADIVRSRLPKHPVVVVSAMGKTTNALLAMAANAAQGKRPEALAQLRAIEDFHRSEAAPLVSEPHRKELETVLTDHFRDLGEIVEGLCAVSDLTPRSQDAVASFGERLSSRIVALALDSQGIPSTHLDSRNVIVTDSRFTHASPLIAETYPRTAASIAANGQHRVTVMGGFIAANQEGVTTTLGRGGSDFSAALVGAAIDADGIDIWTDVDGVLTCDPTLVPGTHPVKTISFDEAAELAYFGAKVLHPATVLPAKEKNIPVWILNSRRPEAPGTKIVANAVSCTNVLKSVACKKGITVVNIRSTRMLGAHGFLRRIFEAFDRFETPVDMVSTSEVSVSLTVDDDARLPGNLRRARAVHRSLHRKRPRHPVRRRRQNPRNPRRSRPRTGSAEMRERPDDFAGLLATQSRSRDSLAGPRKSSRRGSPRIFHRSRPSRLRLILRGLVSRLGW